MFEETTPISESMTPLIAAATIHGNPPLIEDHHAATTLLGNTLNDAVERRSSVPDFDLEEAIDEQKEFTEEQAIRLAEEIHKCWGDHQNRRSSIAKSRVELRGLRSRLAAQLHNYKKHIVRVGRDGGWAPFLRERGHSAVHCRSLCKTA
jgi:hypothetical protein